MGKPFEAPSLFRNIFAPFLTRGSGVQAYPYFSLGVAGMIPTARVERAHSDRARSVSKGIVPATPSLTS